MRPELESALRVTVVEEPTVVAGIEGYRRLKYTLMSGIGVFVLGLSLLTFFEARNRRIIAAHDVSEHLGLQVIGTVPALPAGAAPLEATESSQTLVWRQSLTECVDATRTMLIHAMGPPKPGLTVLVTSALPGEGKTMLACQLATSLARGGLKTLLIDGDLRRPNIHTLLGIPQTPGLSELLRGEASLAEAVRSEVAPGLALLPAGMWDQRVSQTLATERGGS